MQFLQELQNARLFYDISQDEIPKVLHCLGAKVASYEKGGYVLAAGDPVDHIGIVLSGQLDIVKEDLDAERSLLSRLVASDHFAETLCCAGETNSPVSVIAQSNAQVLWIDFQKILHTCANACTFHTKLLENMLFVIASRNLHLQKRMEFLSKKTIRKRILAYLFSQSGGDRQPFSIPFDRQELADYLSIDRSALSRELAHLQTQGVLMYHKNEFTLL